MPLRGRPVTIGSRTREYFVHHENLKHRSELIEAGPKSQSFYYGTVLKDTDRSFRVNPMTQPQIIQPGNNSLINKTTAIRKAVRTKIYDFQKKQNQAKSLGVAPTGRAEDSTFIDTKDYFFNKGDGGSLLQSDKEKSEKEV